MSAALAAAQRNLQIWTEKEGLREKVWRQRQGQHRAALKAAGIGEGAERDGADSPVAAVARAWTLRHNAFELVATAREKQAAARRRVVALSPMKLSPKGEAFIHASEGFSAVLYNDGADPQPGHATIGWGHLVHRGAFTRADVAHWGRITRAEGDRLFRADMEAEGYLDAVRHADARHGLHLKPHEFDALVSFVYNLGVGSLSAGPGFETIGHALASGKGWQKRVASALPLYINRGSPVEAGLRARRKREALLITTGRYTTG